MRHRDDQTRPEQFEMTPCHAFTPPNVMPRTKKCGANVTCPVQRTLLHHDSLAAANEGFGRNPVWLLITASEALASDGSVRPRVKG
jgi:hypothetical protein